MKVFAALFLFAVACLYVLTLPTEAGDFKLNPVLIIPGDAGSIIEAKLDKPKTKHYYCRQHTSYFMRLWIDATYFIPGLIDCWCDNMKLSYDSISKELDDSSGVNIRVPFFGSVQSIETLDNRFGKSLSNYFGTVIANLEDIGYKRDVSLRAAPYDFRYAPSSCEGREYIDRTVKLIEQMYRENGDTPVVLMSHSLGGLYGLYLLNHQSQEWKDQYIRMFMPLVAPWGGTINILRALTSGDNQGISTISHSALVDTQRTFETNYWVMPHPEIYSDRTLISTPSRNYTGSDEDMTALFKDLKFDLGSILRERTMNLTRSLQAPAVPTFCVYSMGILTDDSYSWDKDNRLDLFPNNTRADGDGTVNIESAKMCNRWATDPAMKGKPFARKVFFKQQHRPMLFEEEVVFFIADTLINIAKDDFPVSMPPFQIDSEADDADVEAAAARVEAQDTEAEDWDHDFPIPDHPDNLVNQMKKSATKVGGRTLMEPVGGYGFMPLNISTVPFARDADPAFASSSSSSSSSSTVKVSIL